MPNQNLIDYRQAAKQDYLAQGGPQGGFDPYQANQAFMAGGGSPYTQGSYVMPQQAPPPTGGNMFGDIFDTYREGGENHMAGFPPQPQVDPPINYGDGPGVQPPPPQYIGNQSGNPFGPMPPMSQQPMMPGGDNPFGNIGPWSQPGIGGQQQMSAEANPFDYDALQGFMDSAYDQSRRYLDPLQEQQNERQRQDMINMGLDPNSEAGQQAADQLGRVQADANSKAMFDAMGFGQGMQQQMFGQDLASGQLGNQAQQALWNAQLGASGQGMNYALGQGGLFNQYGLGMGGLGNQRFGLENQFNLGQGQLGLGQQQQNWNEMFGMENLGMQQWQMNQLGQQWQDKLGLALMGIPDIGGVGGFQGSIGQNPGNQYSPWGNYYNDLMTGSGWGGGGG